MYRTFIVTCLCLSVVLARQVVTVAAEEKVPKLAAGREADDASPGMDEIGVKQPATVWSPRTLAGKAKGAWLSLVKYWKKDHYRFTPTVRAAYMKFARAEALAELAVAKKRLPQDFLDWVDRDAVVSATVYGARRAPAKVLVMLYSLELDLGKKAVRRNYTQLALAEAVVHASEGPKADLTPRDLLTLTIPPCPLHPVNTKDRHRRLDLNDHIINFLNDHAPVAEPRPGGAERPHHPAQADRGVQPAGVARLPEEALGHGGEHSLEGGHGECRPEGPHGQVAQQGVAPGGPEADQEGGAPP